jgi:hypothetical protein
MAFTRRTIRSDVRDLETLLKLSTGQLSARDATVRYARGLGRNTGLGQIAADVLGEAAGALHDVTAPLAAKAARTLLNAMRWKRGNIAAQAIRAREARDAMAFLDSMGIETPLAEQVFGRGARGGQSGTVEPPPVQAPPVQPGYGGRGGRGGSGSGGRTGAPAPPPPPGQPRQEQYPSPGSRAAPTGAPPRPGEESPFSAEILTPQSSNVFSFAYDAQTSTLYVTYKAPKINPEAVHTGRGRGGAQLVGRLGRTVIGKTNDRGPMYAYFDVPARVYKRMILAHSKGKFVWDELRVRGTVWGHVYRYRLMQGSVTPGVGGVYIPRRATQRGFRTRASANVGTGRRGFSESTLAEQFSEFGRGGSRLGSGRGRGRGEGRGGRGRGRG